MATISDFTFTAYNLASQNAIPSIYRDGVLIHQNAVNDGTFDDAGLSPNTAYAYQIVNVLNERPSTALSGTAYTNPVAPGTPTSGTHATTTIDIAWVNGDATAKTEIHVDDGLGGSFSIFSTENAGVTSKQISGLTSGRTYLVKLKHKGVVSNQTSAFSAALSQATD